MHKMDLIAFNSIHGGSKTQDLEDTEGERIGSFVLCLFCVCIMFV